MSFPALKIAVSGFPGTGKTTLVKALGERLGLPTIDEEMTSIGNADRLYVVARNQNHAEDLPSLKKELIESFLTWDRKRTELYEGKDGFIADRWEADLLDWWLVRFGLGTNSVDEITGILLKNFQKKSKYFDFVVIMPLQKPFTKSPNEQGIIRKSDLTTHILNTVVTSGLIQNFTNTPVLRIPSNTKSLTERVNFIESAINKKFAASE